MPKINLNDAIGAIDNLGLYIEGTAGADTLWGSQGDDGIHGLAGHDVIYGQDGDDSISGGAGNDTLMGNAGDDTLDGGTGNDWLEGGEGADVVKGGNPQPIQAAVPGAHGGFDTVSYASSSAVTVQLGYRGFGGQAEGDTYFSIENVYGSIFADSLVGDAANNILNAAGGHDDLIGGAGRDILIGGAGIDTLTGDTAGVYNNDVFIVQKWGGEPEWPGYMSYDKIADFQQGYDKIGLSGYTVADFGSDGKLGTGTLYEDGIVSFTSNLDATDTLYWDDFAGALFECTIEMINGEAHMIDYSPVVKLGFGNYIGTSDFFFIDGSVTQFAADLQASFVEHGFPDELAPDFTDGVMSRDLSGDRADDVVFQNAANGQVLYAQMEDGAFQGWGSVTGALGTDFRAVGTGNINPGAAGGAEVFIQQQSTGAIYTASIDSGATTWGVVSASLTPDYELKAVADLNGDGAADAIVQNASTGAILYAAMQDGAFQGWGVVNQNLDADWKAVGAGDIDGDGFADVVVQQQSSGTTLYADMANGEFSGWGVVANSVTPEWEVKGVGDLNGDGFADVLFQQASTGTALYADMANGAFDHWDVAAQHLTTDWQAAGLADLDADGDQDVLFQNSADGTTLYAEMGANGFESWGLVTNSINADWQVV